MLRPPSPKTPSYIARIEKIESDAAGRVKMWCRWYYRPEESIGGRRCFHGVKELFLSDHYDGCYPEAVEGVCSVHNLKDYAYLDVVEEEDFFCRFEYNASTGMFAPESVAVYCKCEMPYNPDNLMLVPPGHQDVRMAELEARRLGWSARAIKTWSARAIKTFGMAELEARKLKYPTTGTEALLMGMLTEGTNYGARFMRANGIKLMDLRVRTVELLGKADMYYFSAEHPPLTEPALAALQWAIAKHKELGRTGEISTALILLGIWEQRECAGHKLLAQLGFHDALASQLTADLSAVAA
ncbi:unnamed protein product [Closterium sp. NIES-64]|nr:unnamed protein product [Closterium sp. NIES-64]